MKLSKPAGLVYTYDPSITVQTHSPVSRYSCLERDISCVIYTSIRISVTIGAMCLLFIIMFVSDEMILTGKFQFKQCRN